MDLMELWSELQAQGVAVWLDGDRRLRIGRDAPEELKDGVREQKAEIIAILEAHDLVNRCGLRGVSLPLGGFALAWPPGPMPEEVRAAIRTLRMDHLPIVHETRGKRFVPWKEWLAAAPIETIQPPVTQSEESNASEKPSATAAREVHRDGDPSLFEQPPELRRPEAVGHRARRRR